MADRYTYIPSIGVFIVLIYGAADGFNRWRLPRSLALAMVSVSFCAMILVTRTQIGYWKDTESLFLRNVEVAGETAQFHHAIALEEEDKGNEEMAKHHYQRAVELNPTYMARVFNEMGYRHAELNELDPAESLFRRSLSLRPDYANAHNNLGVILGRKGRGDEAIREFSEAVRLSPEYTQARANLDSALNERAQKTKP